MAGVIFAVNGGPRMPRGECLEFMSEAGHGDFICVLPFVPHKEIDAIPIETRECVLLRSDGDAVPISLAIEHAAPPEDGAWIDPTHPA